MHDWFKVNNSVLRLLYLYISAGPFAPQQIDFRQQIVNPNTAGHFKMTNLAGGGGREEQGGGGGGGHISTSNPLQFSEVCAIPIGRLTTTTTTTTTKTERKRPMTYYDNTKAVEIIRAMSKRLMLFVA